MADDVKEKELYTRKTVMVRIVNSTLFFVLTYIISLFFYQFVKASFAWWFECKPVFHYNIVEYMIDFDTWYQYGRRAIVGVFGSGAFFSLLAGGVLLFIYDIYQNKRIAFKLFVLWLSVHMLMNFFGKLVVSPLEETTGLGIVLRWYYVSQNARLVIGLITLVVIFAVGMLLRKPFLEMAPSTKLVKTLELRKKYLWQIGILPAILGSILAVGFNLPNYNYKEEDYLILVCTIALMFSCYFFTAQMHKPVRAYKNRIPQNINYWVLGAIIILFVVFNFVWEAGIEFY